MTTALADKIRSAFERSGLSQRDLATAVGVDESTVSLWLSGERTPRVKNLEKLARAMGLEARELWSGPEATPVNEVQAKVLEDMNHLSPAQQEVVAAVVRSMRSGA
jgi:transcriptional regulator with XRE-family HTH domain